MCCYSNQQRRGHVNAKPQDVASHDLPRTVSRRNVNTDGHTYNAPTSASAHISHAAQDEHHSNRVCHYHDHGIHKQNPGPRVLRHLLRRAALELAPPRRELRDVRARGQPALAPRGRRAEQRRVRVRRGVGVRGQRRRRVRGVRRLVPRAVQREQAVHEHGQERERRQRERLRGACERGCKGQERGGVRGSSS